MQRMNLFTRTLLLGCTVFYLSSCDKNEEPEPAQKSAVTEYIESREAAPQKFSVSTSSTQTITTSGGMDVTIPANSFVDMDGNPVSGDVDFDIIEIYNKSDMIKSARPTMSDGNVLISGGEFSFSASIGGEQVQLKDNGTITVQSPSPSGTIDLSMSLFIGGEDSIGQFNWDEIFGTSMDTMAQGSRYFFDIDTLAWINIDKFYGATTTDLTINLEAGFTTERALTYIVFNDINSVLMPSTYNGTINETNYVQSLIPVGESITVICIAEKDGNLYLAESDLTTTTNGTVNLTFTQMTSEEVDAILEGLD